MVLRVAPESCGMIGSGVQPGLRIAVITAMTLLSSPATAGSVVVMSQDQGRSCYLQTLREASPENNRRGVAICGEAISESGDDSYNRAAALVNRAAIRLRIPDFPGVVADAEAAIALEPGIAEGYANRGAGLIGQGKYQDALVALNKAVELESPKSEIAYYNRAVAKEALGDIKGAYYDFKAAAEINSRFSLASEQLVRFRVTRQ
jgi:tetratricopeptide (TPR) repeat protein